MSCPWPKGFIGFGFEKPENCSQNGSENPPHAAHFFWPKIHGVLGRHLKIYSGEKKTNATSVIMHHLTQAI